MENGWPRGDARSATDKINKWEKLKGANGNQGHADQGLGIRISPAKDPLDSLKTPLDTRQLAGGRKVAPSGGRVVKYQVHEETFSLQYKCACSRLPKMPLSLLRGYSLHLNAVFSRRRASLFSVLSTLAFCTAWAKSWMLRSYVCRSTGKG